MKANPRDVCFEGPTKFEMMCCFQGHKQGLLKQCGIAIPPTLYTRDKHGQLTHILDYLSCQLYIIRLFECATFLLLLVGICVIGLIVVLFPAIRRGCWPSTWCQRDAQAHLGFHPHHAASPIRLHTYCHIYHF